MSPHADHDGVVSCRMIPNMFAMCQWKIPDSSTTICKKHNRQHNHSHHGEHPPPLAARIWRLDPIQRKREVDKLLGEGAVEAIY